MSERQRDVAFHILEGRASKEIARLMGLSPLTVGTHRRELYRRLGVHSAAQLCRIMRSDAPLP